MYEWVILEQCEKAVFLSYSFSIFEMSKVAFLIVIQLCWNRLSFLPFILIFEQCTGGHEKDYYVKTGSPRCIFIIENYRTMKTYYIIFALQQENKMISLAIIKHTIGTTTTGLITNLYMWLPNANWSIHVYTCTRYYPDYVYYILNCIIFFKLTFCKGIFENGPRRGEYSQDQSFISSEATFSLMPWGP